MKDDPAALIRECTSQIRAVVDDLLTDLAETENARQSAQAKVFAPQLPEPDPTKPANWRFAADVIAAADGFSRFRADDTLVVVHLRREADRLEAAQQQADADEELIEKAARVLYERTDWSGCAGSAWDALDSAYQKPWIDMARALHAANLLRDGEK
ncbi:hypothetical protein EF294_03250 [Gordonia oryzae]|uniref:Uncharacterized protein n=1 Tax=Gordonia oryzae TaxID=2487349 RepID=A0A3N4GWF7_9ACTN|nr:hypothetical protein [Gordonia oryzae]RPA65767.1 hypothetical protein EF294_03250 [Gordonia oryzae]